ncbi:major facilitator superfamily domain-containing protein [Phyllosticta citriasiana]|uniref:major facilitator superfamily domain-containing protein n=1 Tax=Phyllosticta citriasiana TaxID=595635 RepID=UPI0030FD9775
MLGLNLSVRSLIQAKSLGIYQQVNALGDDGLDPEDEAEGKEEEYQEEHAMQNYRSNHTQQLTWIYVAYLAEAIVASSLQPQLKMLISNDDFCGSLSTSYLRSILDCAYAFGGTVGILWGYLADRVGRKPIALGGLFGMAMCCLSVGLATDLITCTVLRFAAGLVSSSVVVSTLTMIGDLSASPANRAQSVARLPLVGVCGSIGLLVQGMVAGSVNAHGAVWEKYPILSSQIACGSLVLIIAVAATFALDETLPRMAASPDSTEFDCERTAFLGQDDLETPSIRVVDFNRPEPIGLGSFLRAPSLLILLCSFSILSLHASSFDVLLPHLGHSSSRQGGMGLPCNYLGLILLAVRAVAGIAVLHAIPRAVERFGLLRPFRSLALFFPAIYILTPILVFVSMCSAPLTAVTSTTAIIVKHTLANAAQALVTLLMLNVAPDAFSAGTVIGLMQTAWLFKALAVAVSGASFYLSNDFSITTTNYALWISLAVLAAVGAALAWFVRERPSVEKDFPAEVLCWETCFDAEGEAPAYKAEEA